MSRLTIGQVAEHTGFSASTLRFYEKRGLLEPVERTESGYRSYDHTSLARLAFINRAKQLGCTLDEITDLVELWEADHCEPVQAGLRKLVGAKLDDAQRRNAELATLTAQLQTAAARLAGDPADGPCTDSCACVDDTPASDGKVSIPVEPGPESADEIVCTLDDGKIGDRLADWRTVLSHVTVRETTPDGRLRLILDRGAPLDDIVALAVAEQHCCSFFAFAITVDGRGIALEVDGPAGAADVIDALFAATP